MSRPMWNVTWNIKSGKLLKPILRMSDDYNTFNTVCCTKPVRFYCGTLHLVSQRRASIA